MTNACNCDPCTCAPICTCTQADIRADAAPEWTGGCGCGCGCASAAACVAECDCTG